MVYHKEIIQRCYARYPETVEKARKILGRPLTLTEKILYNHLFDGAEVKAYERGKSYAEFQPDRVAMQDATAQMALLQFIHADKETTVVPASIHCDHLVQARDGAESDLKRALVENQEVYDFLRSMALRYNIHFWEPGAGIIHQIVLENYAFPGGMMIGTDSHTPNAGGLGMMGIGVGGSDAVDVMVGIPWELKWPKIIGVKLTGRLQGWASPKDVILALLGKLTVKGGTGCVMEYFGPGARALSATGKATICNMGAELGATSSVFPYDEKMAEYLRRTGREEVAAMAEAVAPHLRMDDEVEKNPHVFYDQVIEIDLSSLEPHLNGPFTPDLAHPLSTIREAIEKENYPAEVSAGLIGSCTNSSYEDLSRAAFLLREAMSMGIKPKAKLYLSPGSDQIRATLEKDGILEVFRQAGAVILSNTCGPCIGMWDRYDMAPNTRNTIVTTFNRNFAKRADGNPNTYAFVASPEMVVAVSLAGRLDFDPRRDTIRLSDGRDVSLPEPCGQELPEVFSKEVSLGLLPPAEDPKSVRIIVSPTSDRLQLLDRFSPWNGEDFRDCRVLMKVSGKCTTDHISMAGPWLKYRGHLDNISNNLLLGATNAFTGETGKVKNLLTGEYQTPAEVARMYKANRIPWVIIGDRNYGEGSSREHAAMEPRHLGGVAVIARSFARIHETNLKKQGLLALTFVNESDYEKIQEDDRIDIPATALQPGKILEVVLHHRDGTSEVIPCQHSYSETQIAWFKAGSALNLITSQGKK
ncbi:Aconitate hydratase [Brevinematales bacterium NS]|nr:Aconitate hydratase [Brevinematales bacterium NS]